MRIMAVVAGGIGVRLIDHARPRVDRIHVTLDLLHHLAEPGVLIGAVRALRLVPQVAMALHAADQVLHALLMRHAVDVLVAMGASLLAVDTGSEALPVDVQRTHRPIGTRHGEPGHPVAVQTQGILGRRRRLGVAGNGTGHDQAGRQAGPPRQLDQEPWRPKAAHGLPPPATGCSHCSHGHSFASLPAITRRSLALPPRSGCIDATKLILRARLLPSCDPDQN